MRDILIGWKEISSYLHVSERTAQRYHKERELPIKYDPAKHPIIMKKVIDNWRISKKNS
jgi:hypothetical protein